MIKSFCCRETERLFNYEPSRRFHLVQRAALRRLHWLNNAERLEDLYSPPGNRLEALKGARVGQHSIRINSQWRICFVWEEGNAFEVEIVDYH